VAVESTAVEAVEAVLAVLAMLAMLAMLERVAVRAWVVGHCLRCQMTMATGAVVRP
jgi:hypothetical protein